MFAGKEKLADILCPAYTEVINLLNYSVVVIPVTKANKDIDVVDPCYEPLNDLDKKNWEAYDAEMYDGAPVGLQLVARKFEEEKDTWYCTDCHCSSESTRTHRYLAKATRCRQPHLDSNLSGSLATARVILITAIDLAVNRYLTPSRAHAH